MKKGTWLLLGGILGGALLISSIILIIVNNYEYNRDKKRYKEQEIMAEINSDYDSYKGKTASFSEERTIIVEEITDYLSFYSKMEKNYSKIVKNLEKYETLIEDIENSSQKLNSNCIGKTYYKYDITNKCKAYESSFEQTVNSFVRNFEQYNKVIKDYNEWTKKQEGSTYKELSLFTTGKYKDYIDINNDGNFEGKNKTTEDEEIKEVEETDTIGE